MNSTAAMAAIGALSEDRLRNGIERRIRIRQSLGEVPTDRPKQAMIVITALILSTNEEAQKRQLSIIESTPGIDWAKESDQHSASLQNLSAADQFAVMELCYPGLRKLAPSEKDKFSDLLDKLANEDGKISLREALILDVIHRQFGRSSTQRRPSNSLEGNPRKFAKPISDLLYLVASLECTEPELIESTITNAIQQEDLLSGVVSIPQDLPTLDNLSQTLDPLHNCSFSIRKQILSAAAKIILSDDETTDREWTFLQLVSLSLGVPMPPLGNQ